MVRIALSLIFLLVVFLISHFFFEPTYLYYEIWWLDIPMHILGGLGVGSLAYSVLSYRKIPVTYWKLVLVFVVIAFAWELYEYIRGLNPYASMDDYLDTLKDTIDGLVGVSVAYFFIRKA